MFLSRIPACGATGPGDLLEPKQAAEEDIGVCPQPGLPTGTRGLLATHPAPCLPRRGPAPHCPIPWCLEPHGAPTQPGLGAGFHSKY